MAYTLQEQRLNDFLCALCKDRVVFTLQQADDEFHLVCAVEWEPGKHTLGAFRPVEPLKSLVFRPRESVGDSEVPVVQERIVIGVTVVSLDCLKAA